MLIQPPWLIHKSPCYLGNRMRTVRVRRARADARLIRLENTTPPQLRADDVQLKVPVYIPAAVLFPLFNISRGARIIYPD